MPRTLFNYGCHRKWCDMPGLIGQKAWIKAAKQQAKNIQNNIAKDIIDTLHEVTPRRTGTLVNGYHIEDEGDITYIVNEVPYHDYVNDGTDKTPPRAMIEIALARVSTDAKKYTGKV